MADYCRIKDATRLTSGFFARRHKSPTSRYGYSGWLPIAILTLLLFVATSAFTYPALAQSYENESFWQLPKSSEIEKKYLYSSLYTRHYDPEPEHVNNQNLLGFEFEMENNSLWGVALFDNSFGQKSQYLYLGRTYRAFDSDHWHYKLTGGLLHGYKEPYEDKIPLNDLGVAPAIVPTIGYHRKSFFAEYSQLGLAAGMITAGIAF